MTAAHDPMPEGTLALLEELSLTRKVDEKGNVVYTNEQGEYHRTHGPAITYRSGSEEWFLNGDLHREDGPAVIRKDGATEWWINDVRRHDLEDAERKRRQL